MAASISCWCWYWHSDDCISLSVMHGCPFILTRVFNTPTLTVPFTTVANLDSVQLCHALHKLIMYMCIYRLSSHWRNVTLIGTPSAISLRIATIRSTRNYSLYVLWWYRWCSTMLTILYKILYLGAHTSPNGTYLSTRAPLFDTLLAATTCVYMIFVDT